MDPNAARLLDKPIERADLAVVSSKHGVSVAVGFRAKQDPAVHSGTRFAPVHLVVERRAIIRESRLRAGVARSRQARREQAFRRVSE